MVSSWEEAKPAFDLFPMLESAIWLENAIIAAILVYGFITGVMIWSGNENGKVLAERYLQIRLSAFVLVELLLLGMLSDLPGEVYAALVGGVFGALFREAIFFGVWYAYFKKSKRVAATYGS